MKITALQLSTLVAMSFVSLSSSAQTREAPDWNFAAGLGVATLPRFPGAKQSRVLPIPVLSASYKDLFFADTVKGLGVQGEVADGLTLSASVGVSTDERRPKDSDRLQGLKNIGMAPDIMLGAHYAFDRAFVDLGLSERVGRQDRRGGIASLELGYNLLAGPVSNLAVGVNAHAMDKNYARNFFAIDSQQSAASGLPVHDAKAGLKDVGLFVQGQYQIDKNWSLASRVAANKLEGSAARSPVVEKRLQPSLFVSVSRAF